MALNDDAVKAAAGALSEYYEGDGWGYFGGAAEAAVAAAAPILLAAERARVAAAIRVEAAAVGVYLETEGDRVYGAGLRKAARIAETAPEEPGRCKAHRDGECHWTGCPQVRDGEPRATGRHCPLDNRTAPEEES